MNWRKVKCVWVSGDRPRYRLRTAGLANQRTSQFTLGKSPYSEVHGVFENIQIFSNRQKLLFIYVVVMWKSFYRATAHMVASIDSIIENVEGLWFHCSVPVCLFVSVFAWFSLKKKLMQLFGCTNLDAVFAKWLLFCICSDLI